MQNAKVKEVTALQQKASVRRERGLLVVEGCRELERCVSSGYEVVSLFVCPELSDVQPAGLRCESANVYEVTRAVYEKMAYRGGTEGVLGVVRARHLTLDDLTLGDAPLLVVVEGVEKPGNLGAILRSADAAGADAVIVCDGLTDVYNPNVIRNSVGTVFAMPCVTCRSEDCISFLKACGIRILTAQLQDSSLYYRTDMRQGTAIVMGTESTGLTMRWRQAADEHIRIPMAGIADSLNVSVSASILLFEAVRQRHAQNGDDL